LFQNAVEGLISFETKLTFGSLSGFEALTSFETKLTQAVGSRDPEYRGSWVGWRSPFALTTKGGGTKRESD